MGIQISLVKADDWEGLYVSERLVCEDHGIEVEEVMAQVLHNHVDQFTVYDVSDTWMAMVGSFPIDLREVVLEDGRTVQEHWEDAN